MAENLYQIKKENTQELRAGAYTGTRHFHVIHDEYGCLTVYAPEITSAIYAAGKHWGADPKKAAFHQGCRIMQVG